jgi:hypothetical protein
MIVGFVMAVLLAYVLGTEIGLRYGPPALNLPTVVAIAGGGLLTFVLMKLGVWMGLP